MPKKIRVAVLFGGKSAEHEVSLWSAKSVIDNLDRDKYEPVLIGIDQQGRWLCQDAPKLLASGVAKRLNLSAGESLTATSSELALVPGEHNSIIGINNGETFQAVDVVFPVLHGPYGEDGAVQGLLKLANIPYVGAGVLGSAVGMDKDVQKRLLAAAGIPVAKFVVVERANRKLAKYEQLVNRLGSPLFVKPANLGSSVGVGKVHNAEELEPALEEAFEYDRKVLIEEFVKAREIECAVLGNEEPIASLPGEIRPQHEFYSYEAKYLDEHGAELDIPAKLSDEQTQRIRRLAVETFKILCCEGMARVDFFLNEKGEFLVNEINTIPGFTNISMYPKLWEATGIPYGELLDKLIHLALERFESEKKLKVTVQR